MTNYVFIESRDPFESRDTQFVVETATTLVQRGHQVTVFLVQNGVLGTRRNIAESNLSRLIESGIILVYITLPGPRRTSKGFKARE